MDDSGLLIEDRIRSSCAGRGGKDIGATIGEWRKFERVADLELLISPVAP